MNLTHKDYFKIAFPFIVSTVTQPLLGAVDTAVIGKLGVAEMIGGVAIGTVIMNTLYWLFGFFRVSTTGQSAIALGKNSPEDQASSLFRPFVISLCLGLIFIALQSVIWMGAELIISPDAVVAENAKIYFDMGIAGVAVATLIAQISTFVIGAVLVLKTCRFTLFDYIQTAKMTRKDLKVIASSNMDLLLRTVCLLVFFNMMARVGSQLGSDVLAANAILMQVTFIVSYMFDGVANASSVFAGKAVGQKKTTLLDNVIKLNTQWTAAFVVVLTLLLVLFKHQLVTLFTTLPNLVELYLNMSPWLLAFPLVAGFGLTFYGIFTGTGTTRPVRNSTFLTMVLFLVTQFIAVQCWGNHGLWLAFTLFYVGRFVFLFPYLDQVKQKCQ